MSAVEFEVDGRVARITLNRPERGNGITRSLLTELEACVERADLDPAVHVLLLSGAGRASVGGTTWLSRPKGRVVRRKAALCRDPPCTRLS